MCRAVLFEFIIRTGYETFSMPCFPIEEEVSRESKYASRGSDHPYFDRFDEGSPDEYT